MTGLGELLAHHRLALGLGPGIEGGGGGIGAQGRDMQQALHASGPGSGRDAARALGMDGGEALRPMLIEHAHQIDHMVHALDGGGHRGVIADIGGDGGDLADIAQGLQEQGGVRPAHGDAQDPAAPGEALDDIAPDEARAPEDCRNRSRHCLTPSAKL